MDPVLPVQPNQPNLAMHTHRLSAAGTLHRLYNPVPVQDFLVHSTTPARPYSMLQLLILTQQPMELPTRKVRLE